MPNSININGANKCIASAIKWCMQSMMRFVEDEPSASAHAVPVVSVRHRRAAAGVLVLRGSARLRLLPRLRTGRTGARAVLPTAAAASRCRVCCCRAHRRRRRRHRVCVRLSLSLCLSKSQFLINNILTAVGRFTRIIESISNLVY